MISRQKVSMMMIAHFRPASWIIHDRHEVNNKKKYIWLSWRKIGFDIFQIDISI